MDTFIEYDWNPYKLPADLLQAIGLVMAASSQTEAILNLCIGGCLGLDHEYAAATTAHMSVPLKMSIALAAAEIRLDDLDALDKLDVLLTAVKDALDLRYSTAHDSWCRDPATRKTYRATEKARVRLEVDIIPITFKELLADAGTITRAGLALMLPIELTGDRPRGHKSKAARKARRAKGGK